MKRAMVMGLLTVLLMGLGGCIARTEFATSAAEHANSSILNYQKNTGAIVEAFIAQYRTDQRAHVDELTDAALKAEVGADGRANARNVQIIETTRLEKYKAIEEVCSSMRSRWLAVQQDAANALQLTDSLRGYYQQTLSTSESAAKAEDQLVALLTELIRKRKGNP